MIINAGNTPQTFVYPNQSNKNELIEIAKKFQVGDLVFTKMNEGFNIIDSFTVLLQKIAGWIYSKNKDASYSKYTHSS